MALTDAERTDVRRHCGYAVVGGAQGGVYLQYTGLLEYRMTRLSGAEEAVARQYLVALAELEAAVPQASAMLDTDQAAVWKRNPREVRERTRLFDDWRRRLCGFLGVPPGPALGEAGVRVVV
jgi:hypothetical protein